MALLQAYRDKVEAFRDNLAPKLVARQNTYLANHGRYWQGVFTPGTVPDGAADTVPDGTRRPTDQLETWADFLGVELPATFPAMIWVDVYDGPMGKGWTVTALVRSEGDTWSRTWNVGPETYRAKTWARVDTFTG